MTDTWEVVVVSSDLEKRLSVAAMLTQQGVDTICASTVDQFREVLHQRNVGLVFCDREFGDGDYHDVVEAARSAATKVPKVVVMSGFLKSGEYHQAKGSGVFEIISTPCRPTDLEWMVILAKRAELIQAKQSESSRPISALRPLARAQAS